MGRPPRQESVSMIPQEDNGEGAQFSDLGIVQAYKSIVSTFGDTNKDLLLKIAPLNENLEKSIKKSTLLASLPDIQTAVDIIELYKQIVRNQSEIISHASRMINELEKTFNISK